MTFLYEKNAYKLGRVTVEMPNFEWLPNFECFHFPSLQNKINMQSY